MTKEETKIALQKAVEYLETQRLITGDKDIIDKTGFKKSAVSLYIRGTAGVSDKFARKFEEVFKLSLEEFKPQGVGVEDFEKLYYAQIKENNDTLKKFIQTKEDQISSLQKELQEVKGYLSDIVKNQLTLDAGLQGVQEVILRKLSSDEVEFQSLVDSAYNIAVQHRRESEKMGNRILIGS